MSFNHSARSRGIIGISFFICFNTKVWCVFSLESPHQGVSKEHTQYTIFIIKNKITLDYPKSAALDFIPRDSRKARNSRGKRAISVQATEVLLYRTHVHVHESQTGILTRYELIIKK